MMSAFHYNAESTASEIVRRLAPSNALVTGADAGRLAEALRCMGVNVKAPGSLNGHPAHCFDLVVCAAAFDESAAHASAENLKPAGSLLLVECAPESLQRFAYLGLTPDLSFDASFFSPGAVLFHKNCHSTVLDPLALAAMILRLRREMAENRAEQAREMGELRDGIAAVSAAIGERLESQRHVLDTVVARQHDVLENLLHSRIWRTLCAAGAVALQGMRVGRFAAAAVHRVLTLGGGEQVRLCIDGADSDRATFGSLYVRGWAVSRSGVERVEVEIDGGAPVPACTGLARPDVAAAFPRCAGAERSGFELTVPGLTLAPGARTVRVRAVSRNGRVCHAVRTFDSRRTAYDTWIAQFEHRDPALIPLRLRCLRSQPLISIVVPVYRPEPSNLERAIASVRQQSYPLWELCLASDGPASGGVAEVLEAAATSDPRIRCTASAAHGGISSTSNAALRLAQGEFAGFLDHDDELAPDALLHVAEAIDRNPAVGFLYSDEDKVSPDGCRYQPFFKPAWSPDLLLSENYVCHFMVARLALVKAAGEFRSEYDGSQDHDLALRLSELTDSIVHIPKVLYHWRAADGSTASSSDSKPHAGDASRRAVEDHLRRAGTAARVEAGAVPGRLRVRYTIPSGSRVTIIIPSGGKTRVLAACLETLRARTRFRHYEVLVIDNSRHARVERLVRKLAQDGFPVRSLDWRGRPFNYAAMNNEAARECSTPLLLFLNDDTRVIEPEWLDAMVELGSSPGAGVVGAKLLYPDGRIQHAGVVLGVYHHCGHAFRGLDGAARHYFDFPDVIRNVSAVTGACMLVPAGVFREAGAFDETRFPIAFNDVDLCLRVGRLGYKVLYTPHAVLYHDESLSRRGRGMLLDPVGVDSLRVFWRDVIAADPFYSPNLTRTAEDYTLRHRFFERVGE